jgi:hypothetical protein
MSISADGSRRFRPRFSLLTALLLMTFVGIVIVVVQQWREVGPLRAQVRRLRDEVGVLTIEDESKLHAIQIRQDEELTWRWRVWVPQGGETYLHLQWGNVPKTGVPSEYSTSTLEPGEHWIVLKARRGTKNNTWLSSLQTQSSSSTSSIQDDQHWFDWESSTSNGEGVGHSTEVFDAATKRVILQRLRVGQLSKSLGLQKQAGPTPGFIIWLERQ